VKDKLKIEFITDDNPLYILPFFEEFLRHYATEFEILRVSRCRPMGKRSRVKLLRGLICLYGFTGFLRLTVRLLALRASGLLLFSRRAGPAHSLSQLCRNYSIPCEKTQNPNRPEFVDRIRREAPDLLISVACPYILKEPLLSAPRLGCLNIHHASLPRYRGMMPTFWQMFHRETKVGLTIHWMDAKIDEGEAILQSTLDIVPGETLDHLIQRSKRHGAHCMAQALRKIASPTQTVVALDQSQASYFSFPTLKEMREFRRRGLRAI
jgi:methionyl-tRNA formyltransferase